MLTVSVPKLRAHGPRAAEVRPRRVEAWLAALPQANAEDSLQQILQALFVQNRTALDPDNRLSLMVLYHKPVFNIIESLTRTYAASPHPLSERQYAVATAVQKLCVELANGYKIVANDLTLLDSIEDSKDKFVLALQRAIDTLSFTITNAYAIYCDCPEGVWRDLHQLFRMAELHKMLNYPVQSPEEDTSEDKLVTVYESYQRALLIGASSPYGLSQGECAQLFCLIPHWQCEVQISKKSARLRKDGAGCFLVNLVADRAPIPMTKVAQSDLHSENSAHLRMINTLDVAREIHSILKISDPRDVRAPGTLSTPDANTDLLRRFGRVLAGVNIVRRSNRTPCNHQISICIGLNATHFFASGQRHFRPEPAEPNAKPVNEVARNEEFFDLTDPTLGNAQDTDQPPAARTDPWRNSSVYRLHPCRVTNQSAGGLGIQISLPTELRLRVGDLVGLQFPTPDQWRVGTIRWMRSQSAQLFDVGIQMLAPRLSPVAVRRKIDDDERSPFFQALLLPGNRALRQPESILVPRGTYHKGEKLVLSIDAEQAVISPLHLLDRTTSYDQLFITPSFSTMSDTQHSKIVPIR